MRRRPTPALPAPALAELEASVPSLRRYAWTLLRHTDDADDLVQECLIRALTALPSIDRGRPIRPWLFSVMHNLFVSDWRRRRVRRDSAAAGAIEPVIEASQDWSLAMADLMRAIDVLADDQKQVLLLVSVEGLEYREVAEILQIPIGTVMSRLSRARARLAHLVDGTEQPTLRRVK